MQLAEKAHALNYDQKVRQKLIIKPAILASVGSAALLGAYILILSVLNSFEYATRQFVFLSPWMVPLVLGFGIQVAIFVYMRGYADLVKSGIINKGSVITSAGISTGSMIACCLHHAAEVLPILGISALAVLLSRFQTFLLGVGIVSNVIGILFLLHSINKHGLYLQNGYMAVVNRINTALALKLSIGAGIAFLSVLLLNQL